MKTFKRQGYIYILWSVIFVVLPMIMVFYYAFTNQNGNFTLDNFYRFFSGGTILTLARSLKIAFITTVICLVISYPAAMIIAGFRTRYRTTAMLLVIIPMWMNFLLRTYAWVTLLSKHGILNNILKSIGIGPIDILYTDGAVILGMVYNFLPFMILPIYTILEKSDRGLLEAAADLGANSFTRFRRVTFPLSLPGVVSGISMVFIPAISTFEITALLGGNKTNLIGNVIEQQYTVTGNQNYGASMALILSVFLIISLIFDKESQPKKKNKNRGGSNGKVA